jgi:hypothetical protein
MPFRPDGFHAHEYSSVDDGLLAHLSKLVHGYPYGLDGLFIGIGYGGVIDRVLHGGHVDIFQQLVARK